MTPDDLAAIRANLGNDLGSCERYWLANHILALCTALEQAWAERDHMLPDTEIRPVLECGNLDVLRSALIGVKRGQVKLRERAERAEAKYDALRAWADGAKVDIQGLTERTERAEARVFELTQGNAEPGLRSLQAEAALARVRALCDGWEADGPDAAFVVRRVRAAIEGTDDMPRSVFPAKAGAATVALHE